MNNNESFKTKILQIVCENSSNTSFKEFINTDTDIDSNFTSSIEDDEDWMTLWKDSQKKKDEESYLNYLQRLHDTY